MASVPESVPVDPAYANGIGKGWFPLVEELHKHLLQLDPEYTVEQVKEKYGTLRYYFEPRRNADGIPDSDSDTLRQMNSVVRFAERMSARICEQCGKPGKIRNTGWILTLCDDCASSNSE